MMQRVRIPHRGRKPFVCHSTPHFDSTSRKASYSVAHIIHYLAEKVNPQFSFLGQMPRKKRSEKEQRQAKRTRSVQRYVRVRFVQ